MTTLYRPVLIESAEQAEALPVGTVGHEPPHLYAYIKKARNYWRGTGDDAALTDYEMPPFTALVPIEAEKETRGITTWPRPGNAPWPEHSDLYSNSDGEHYYRDEDGVAHDITEEMTAWLAAQPVHTRYVTPWEET